MTTRVVAVGVDAYENASAFPPLSFCTNDARTIADCFRDVRQLGADADSVTLRTSATPKVPTRNTIIGAVTEMAKAAAPGDRALFFFSGYAWRDAEGQMFLVPEDAYDAEQDALVPLLRVQKILSQSAAKEALILLDAHLPSERPAASPNPKLSAGTHFLARALRGQEPDAFDEKKRLTSAKLAEAGMSIWTNGEADIVLADFGKSVLLPLASPIALAREIRFEDSRPTDVTEILTRIRNWSLTPSQIEHAANAALPEYSAPALGKLVPVLRRALGFSQGTVMVEGGALRFPGGSLESHFEAETKRTGRLVRQLVIDGSWFERPEKIPQLVDVVGLVPDTTTIVLRAPIEVPSLVAGLEASSWTIVSELADEVQAEKLGSEWTFKVDSITVRGMQPDALFGKGKGKKRMAAGSVAGEAIAVFATRATGG